MTIVDASIVPFRNCDIPIHHGYIACLLCVYSVVISMSGQRRELRQVPEEYFRLQERT